MQSETLKKTKAAKFFAAVLTAVVLASAAAAIPVCAVLTAGEARPVIVVDAGHGGLDGGVVGTRTGVKESDLNLAVALLLGGMLEEDGFDVVFTRAGKGGLYLDGERGQMVRDPLGSSFSFGSFFLFIAHPSPPDRVCRSRS